MFDLHAGFASWVLSSGTSYSVLDAKDWIVPSCTNPTGYCVYGFVPAEGLLLNWGHTVQSCVQLGHVQVTSLP